MAISFFAAIIVGTVLLCMPFSTRSGPVSLIDALFTSTSAICVTGLIVQDTPKFFSPEGQAIILVLIQLGGLGIMTFSTLILFVAGRKITIKDRIMVQEGFHPGSPKDFKSLIRNIFCYALILETIGCLSLVLRFQRDFPWPKALALSVFHSVSAFCNAGFSLFSDSLMGYRSDVWINLTVIFLIVFGGLGFLVIQEALGMGRGLVMRKKIRFSLHSRLVLFLTFFLILFSFVLFMAVEWNHSLRMFSGKEKALASLFQVVTPRTAGFNTIDFKTLGTGTVFFIILLMFIGASPGSTGGGVKTSTLGVLFVFVKSKIAARDSVNLFYRTLPSEVVLKAFTLISLALGLVFVSTFLLVLNQPGLSLGDALFEVISAFGTVGLSMGITPKLSTFSKVVIILTMYIGRIGPLTFLYAFSRRKARGRYEYVEESVMIG